MFGRLSPDPVARIHTLVDLAERAVPFLQDEDRETGELDVLASRVDALATSIRMDVHALAAQAEALNEEAEEDLPDFMRSGASDHQLEDSW